MKAALLSGGIGAALLNLMVQLQWVEGALCTDVTTVHVRVQEPPSKPRSSLKWLSFYNDCPWGANATASMPATDTAAQEHATLQGHGAATAVESAAATFASLPLIAGNCVIPGHGIHSHCSHCHHCLHLHRTAVCYGWINRNLQSCRR